MYLIHNFQPSDINFWLKGWTNKNKNLIKKLKSFNHEQRRINL